MNTSIEESLPLLPTGCVNFVGVRGPGSVVADQNATDQAVVRRGKLLVAVFCRTSKVSKFVATLQWLFT